MQWLCRTTAVLLAGEPELEEAPFVAAGREPDPGDLVLAAAAAVGPGLAAGGAEAAVVLPQHFAASANNVRREADVCLAVRARLQGARALPCASTVVCHGAAALGRLQAVYYGTWEQVPHAVCTAAGNIDSGSVFHGFRISEEAGAYWRAAAEDHPWTVGQPRLEVDFLQRQ